MSTPPTWPLPTPERPNPFAPPAEQPSDANAGAQSPYGAGYAPPTGYDAAPTPTPTWSPEPQPSHEPPPAPGYPQVSGYPTAAPGYGPPQGQAYGYPQGPPQVPSYGYPQGQGVYGYPQPQGPYGYPQPQWGNPQPPMDGLAIASISTSAAGIVTMGLTGPVGIGLGIASLRRIRRTGARGRGLAWAGIAVGTAMTLFIAGFVALVVVSGQWTDVPTGSFRPSPAPTVKSQDNVGYLAFDERLWPGDCLEILPAADLLDVAFVDCGAPHAAEVLAYEDFRVAPTASADETAAVFADCSDLASSVAPGALMNQVASSDVWGPSDSDWADGVRSGYCLLVSSPRTLTGSALDGTLTGESTQVQS
ncbi:MAG TPA: DUF4190 domain-containing protein [Cellulomonas sp.]